MILNEFRKAFRELRAQLRHVLPPPLTWFHKMLRWIWVVDCMAFLLSFFLSAGLGGREFRSRVGDKAILYGHGHFYEVPYWQYRLDSDILTPVWQASFLVYFTTSFLIILCMIIETQWKKRQERKKAQNKP